MASKNNQLPIHLAPLSTITLSQLEQLITGYTTNAIYEVAHTETEQQTSFALTLKQLPQPFIHRFSYVDETLLTQYTALLKDRFSVGAYNNEKELVGIALAEAQRWNQTLSIWEFHVLPSYQRQGIGRQLIDWVTNQARAAGLRMLICETQNRNLPAIQAYRKLGFHLHAIDLSLYSNKDYPDGEIAVFMKKVI